MAEPADYRYFLKELFPAAEPDLLGLMQGAADNAHLLRSDFYTIRDWLELAGRPDDAVAPATLLLMQAALEEGSLCLEATADALLPRLLDFVPEEQARGWAKRISDSLAGPGLAALMGQSPAEPRPMVRVERAGKPFLYFQRYLQAEIDFQRGLLARLKSMPTASAPDWAKLAPPVLAGAAFKLDGDQRRALETALANPFTIISGGPGTGKTTIVLSLLRCLIRGGVVPEQIALAAPTGRAAQRLSDSLRSGLNGLADAAEAAEMLRRLPAAATLHHLLGYQPTRNLFTRHCENPIPAEVVIVDEASMVGLQLMANLLQAVAPACKLILLGDKDQLPSVEAGAVLANLVAEHAKPAADRVVLLRTNHRSQAQIRAAAEAINLQDDAIVEKLPAADFAPEAWSTMETSGGCRLLEQTHATPNELRGFLQGWIEQAYFGARLEGPSFAQMIDAARWTDDGAPGESLRRLFKMLDRYRLLTLVRDGTWGCNEINQYLDWHLRPRLDSGARGNLFAGAPVLVTRNDAARGLYNGDVGMTLRTAAGGLVVVFERQDRFLAVPTSALPGHELGFALTVHKSQGSEYANVMVVLPPAGGRRLLTKELIYTAITRAKSLAILCGTKEALKFAIRRRIIRDSGLTLP